MALDFPTPSHRALTWDSLKKHQKWTSPRHFNLARLPDSVLPRTDIGLTKVVQSVAIAV